MAAALEEANELHTDLAARGQKGNIAFFFNFQGTCYLLNLLNGTRNFPNANNAMVRALPS